MIAHLDLAISLYDKDGSGQLKPEKSTRAQMTFDEYNAFASYKTFVFKHYWGPTERALNSVGFDKLKGTRDLAKTVQSQYSAFIAGRPVRWVRGGFPYINMYCDDADVYSETNSAGLTYTEG